MKKVLKEITTKLSMYMEFKVSTVTEKSKVVFSTLMFPKYLKYPQTSENIVDFL